MRHTTSPRMISREAPMDRVTWWRHSNAAGDCAIQGQGTLRPGQASRPACASSSTPGSNGTAQAFIASAMSSETMLTVKAWVARTLAPVSLWLPSRRNSTPSARIAGSADRQLKKLNGAALARPAASTVVTSAIGRGTTAPIRSL